MSSGDARITAGFSPILYSAHGEQALEVEILAGLTALKPAGVFLAPLLVSRPRGTARAFPPAAAAIGAVAAAVVLVLTARLLPTAERIERTEPPAVATGRGAGALGAAPLAAASNRSSPAAAAVAPVVLRLSALQGGAPLADFLVRIEHTATGATEDVRTDVNGLARTAPLAAGEVRLLLLDDVELASDPPDAPLRLMPGAGEPVLLDHDPERASAEPVELSTYAGPCYELELDLPPGVAAGDLHGVLLERDVHDPEAGTRASVVFGMRRGGSVVSCTAPVRTSPGPGAGPWIRFPLQATQLRGDAPWRLELHDDEGYVAGSALVFDKTGAAGTVRVTLRRTGRMLANLAGAARPVAWRVLAGDGPHTRYTPRLGPGRPAISQLREDGLAPGSYRLRVDAWDAAPFEVGFEVVAGRETRIECELEDLVLAGRLAGVVRSASGTLPPRARLLVHDRERDRAWLQPLAAETEVGGPAARFALEHVPAGTYDLELVSSAAWEVEINRSSVRPPDEALVLNVLDGAGELLVEFAAVHARSGASVKRFVLCVTPPGADADAAVLHRAVRGAVECGGMTADEGLRWRILAEGCVPVDGDGRAIELLEPGRGRVRAELVRGWGATVRVRDPDGAPVPEVRVFDGDQELGRTDAQGELVVRRGRTPRRLACAREGWRRAEALPLHRDVAGFLDVTLEPGD